MDRTSDLQLASYLVATGYTLRSIEGPPGRRIFVFDCEISTDAVMRFHGSPERRVLDAHRALKIAVMTA